MLIIVKRHKSLRFIGNKHNDEKLAALTAALDVANDAYLDNNKAPSRRCGEPDNKASHFFVAQYWADALANGANAELAENKKLSISPSIY